jgi:hypothetical protein
VPAIRAADVASKKAITEELIGHSFSASAVSAVVKWEHKIRR